jgi:hypothetical protein
VVISQGAYNAMGRDTPTGIAERTYQAEREARAMGFPTGPSGLPVPRGRAQFRPTVDNDLLKRIADTAAGAHDRQALPDEQRKRIAKILVADIHRRFPPADMQVLEAYGFTRSDEVLLVDLPGLGSPFRMQLAEPVLTPTGLDHNGHRFTARGETKIPRIPESTARFFHKAYQVRLSRDEMRSAHALQEFPRRFKALKGRPPRWEEIEKEFPIIGAWLAAERDRMAEGR